MAHSIQAVGIRFHAEESLTYTPSGRGVILDGDVQLPQQRARPSNSLDHVLNSFVVNEV